MSDPRWNQLAEILVNYSTGTKPGDKVQITMMEVETFPLARAVYAAAVKAGALPHVEFQSAYLERDLMLYGSMEQLNWTPEMLDQYLLNPRKMVPGTKMAFPGLPKEKDRADVIAYLQQAAGTSQ